MAGSQFCVRTVAGFGALADQSNVTRQIPSSLGYYSSSSSSLRFSFELGFWHRCKRSRLILVTCKSSRSFGKSNDAGESDREYLEAFVLLSETIRHYRMRMHGFKEEINWQSSARLFPSSVQAKESTTDVNSIGEFAIEKLIDSSNEDESWDCPNQFQLIRNLVEKLGYRVTMVRITQRVANTYFARIFFGKNGEEEILSVDARPSDAINVAKRCRAPIYVNKQIVLIDGIRIAYATGRIREAKPIYDVSLDSAADGPDLIAKELELVRNMNLAVKEERFNDAAMWREKLTKLRESRHEH